jgi:hypothetical protein
LRRVEEHVLHRIAQQLAARQHAGFGLPDRVADAESLKDVLLDLKPDRPVQGVRGAAPLKARASPCDGAEGRDDRPQVGLGDRHVLVVGAGLRARRIDLRVAAIGRGERLRNGFSACQRRGSEQ